MFKLSKTKEVYWPVKVQIPGDGGKSVAATFEALFEIFDAQAYDDIILGRNDEQKDPLAAVLVGWKNVREEDGQTEVGFTPEKKAEMLTIPYVRTALFEAYNLAATGGRRKN